MSALPHKADINCRDCDVRFVPLIGAQGWDDAAWTGQPRRASAPTTVAHLLRDVAEPITGNLHDVDVGPLLERIGDARVVCLGEATHGTSEFYALRARITKALVERRGFTIVAAEADWPDAARIHRYVKGLAGAPVADWRAFARFPQWMWRNHEVLAFVEWLREWNATHTRAGFYGLDLYSLYRSIRLVLDYLDRVDPAAARMARERYGGLMRWEGDPATYGRAGHIAGSVNVSARDLVDRETGAYLPAATLQEHFKEAGATDAARVITYCGGGIAATSDALVLTLLGHENVAVYDGSLSEWARDESLPMEVGG